MSTVSNLFAFTSICLSLVAPSTVHEMGVCSDQRECGWNSICQAGVCQCLPNYVSSNTNTDCIDTTCDVADCLECSGTSTCRRCLHYIEEGTSKCLDACHTSYELVVEGVHVGRVCKTKQFYGLTRVYVTVIIGISIGVILIIILTVVIYWRMRSDREKRLRLKIMEKILRKEGMSHEKLAPTHFMNHSAGKINHAYAGSQTVTVKSLSLESLHYLHHVNSLSPYLHKLLEMLQLANRRQHQLHPSDPRVTAYKLIAQNLERVVALVSDANSSMPPDGPLLMKWAEQLLQDYTARQKETRSRVDNASQFSCQSFSTVASTSRTDQHLANTPTAPKSSEFHQTLLRSGSVESNREISEVTLDTSNFTDPIDV